MDQLSLPYRIALVALLVLGLAWFTVLKPKEETGSTTAAAPTTATQSQPTAPGATGLGNAVEKAKGAVTASQESAATTEAAAGQATGGTAAPAATTTRATPTASTAKPGTAPATGGAAGADRSGRVISAISTGKVAVVLFSDRRGADDRHVRAVLHRLDRHAGKVAIFSAPIGEVADYAAITRGVLIQQGPSLLVIGKDRKAHAIVGYTDRGEVQQLVDDVLRRTA